MPPSETGTIIVSRTLEKGMRIRSLDVLIDGNFVADIPFGGSVTHTVAPGDHLVAVSNRLFTKRCFAKVGAGETVTFEAGNIISGLGTLLLGVGMPFYKVFLEQQTDAARHP